VNQIIGDWQMTGVFSAATGNYDTATDINDISGGDCGGTAASIAHAPTWSVIPTPSRASRGLCSTPARLGTIRTLEPSATPDATSSKAQDTRPGTPLWSNSFRSTNKNISNSARNSSMCSTTQTICLDSLAPSAPSPHPWNWARVDSAYHWQRDPRQIQLALKFYF